MTPIDFRSDTVTLPTEAMMEAMRSAPLGDDGLDGDPTVRQLESLAAAMMGKDEALFVVSGTMGNLVASLTHACQGGEVIADAGAHIALSEAGGISRLAGLMCRSVPAYKGEMDLDIVESNLRSSHTRHGQPTAMVVVESSHNHAGGVVPSLAYMQALQALARMGNTQVHLDGARLFNAAASLCCDAKLIASYADSLTFCLSKGLSAPMGSILAGSSDFIAKARTYRRMVGGGLRQAGVVAAAGTVALQNMVGRLTDDHTTATTLWSHLRNVCPDCVDPQPPATNIVCVDVRPLASRLSSSACVERLASLGVLVRARDKNTLRFVTHRHIHADHCRVAGVRFAELLHAERPLSE